MADSAAPPPADDAPFDLSLKKKKKKKTVEFIEDPLGVEGGAPAPTFPDEEPSAAPEGLTIQNLDDAFSDLKIKKKKKKATFDVGELEAAESPAPTPTPAMNGAAGSASGSAPTEEVTDFSDLKKKKKSKKAAATFEEFEKQLESSNKIPTYVEGGVEDDDEEGGPDGADENAVNYDEAELGDDVFAGGRDDGDAGGAAASQNGESWHGTDRDYTYAELLGRIMRTLHSQNPDFSSGRKRYTMVPPSVHREGTKKTVFANVADICKRMRRTPEHVISFLFAELGTSGSVDGEKRLVIKGRFQPKQLENVLRRYFVEYVVCKTCKSYETQLIKDNRLYFLVCDSCSSRRSVSAVKTGFVAQIGKRKKKIV